MWQSLTVFLFYFMPISAGMFVFGLINAIRYIIKEDEKKVILHSVVSTTGLIMSLRTLLGVIIW
ncbi:hypothetical protein ACTNDY_06085 [Tissierellaceae bacterium HCP3S3_D8]